MMNQQYVKSVKGWKIVFSPRFNTYIVSNKKLDIYTNAMVGEMRVSWDFMSEITLPYFVLNEIKTHWANN